MDKTDDDDDASSDWLEGSDGEAERSTNMTSMATRDTSKMQRVMYDEGYREGISVGKESMIQPGFDVGYTQTGAPLGRRFGRLRGTIYAVESLLSASSRARKARSSTSDNEEEMRAAVQRLNRRIDGLRMADLVEKDWEALEHEREHGGDVSHIRRETPEERAKREAILPALQAEADALLQQVLSTT